MSRTMLLYFASVAVMWLPATLSMRRFWLGCTLTDRVVGGLVVATGWPLTMPALSVDAVINRRSRRNVGVPR